MTTPRDDIAVPICCYCDNTLSCAHCGKEQPDNAATQLDSLLKEREALQARVKELDDDNAALASSYADICILVGRRGTEEHDLSDDVKAVIDRATRLQQEREIAQFGFEHELQIKKELADALRKAQQERDEAVKELDAILSANDDFRAGLPQDWEGDPLQDACDTARDLVRRLAGPEKEKANASD